MKHLTSDEVNKIVTFLNNEISPYCIILFGSAVKETMREDSDVDIAFLSEKKLNNYDIFIVAQKLSDLLKKEVDLINLEEVSTVFKAQIIGTGQVIHETASFKSSIFRMRSLREYAKLNEEREVVFQKIKEEGMIHE